MDARRSVSIYRFGTRALVLKQNDLGQRAMGSGTWKNFRIWRGRLPHWRADGVVYYVTFRHRQPLDERECDELFRGLTKPGIGRPSIAIVCVLPEKTELMCVIGPNTRGEIGELSDLIEKTKTKTGRAIIKRSGEMFPPFYGESYDRIVRDQAEYEERWQSILASPVESELVEDPEKYPYLHVGEDGWQEPLPAPESPSPTAGRS